MPWLLESETFELLKTARTRAISAEAIEAFRAAERTASKSGVIKVHGVLTPSPDLFASLFGGGNTTYSEITEGIAAADANSAVSEIVLDINSGGGSVAGLFETVDAIRAAKKPVIARVSGMAASAAYAIATAAGRIEAESRATAFGSIGVVQTLRTSDEKIEVTSTNAPKKRPDPKTDDGKAAIREELDALHGLFAESVAEGRDVSVATVNSDFGQGGMLLAGEALERGMIDAIAAKTPTNQAAVRGKPQAKTMNLEELRAQHPETYAAAVSYGVNKERDRAAAFAIAGRESGETDQALKAIESGAEMTQALQTTFAMAAARQAYAGDRKAEDADAEDVLAGVDAKPAAKVAEEKDAAQAQKLLDACAESCGVDLEV